MSEKVRKSLQERLNRLGKALKKAFLPKRENAAIPQLVLQPCRNKQRFEK